MRRLRSSAGFFAAAGGGIRPRLRVRALLPALLVAFALVPVASAAAAEFEVQLDGGGTGTVTGTLVSGGAQVIDCSNVSGSAGPTCSSAGTSGAIEFTATPGPLFGLIGWTVTGSTFADTCSGQENPCRVTPLLSKVTVAADFETLAPAPEVEFPASGVEPVQAISSTGATLHGAVNPRESLLAACRFEAVPQAEPQGFAGSGVTKLPCDPTPATIGDGDGFVDVQANATGLEPNTAYRVRLLAEKTNSIPAQVTSEAPSFTTASAPPLLSSAMAIPGATMATLRGELNPRNSASTYRFEYGAADCASNPCASIPAPDGSAGAGGSPVDVFARPEGLAPETTYHFRLLATNAKGETAETPDQTFTTGALAPARAYELVSPVPTGGVNASAVTMAAESGDRVLFTTLVQPLPGSEAPHNLYVATRGAAGWESEPVDAAPEGPTWYGESGTEALTPDLSEVLLETVDGINPDDQNCPDLDAATRPAQAVFFACLDLYEHQLPGGEFTWISRDPSVPLGTPVTTSSEAEIAGEPQSASLSTNGNVVVFYTRRPLLAQDKTPAGARRIYKWDEGKLSLVSVLPDGSAPTITPSIFPRFYVASTDGSRAVFSAVNPSTGNEDLYQQIDGEPTVDLSDPSPSECTTCIVPSGSTGTEFVGASSDGHQVFFTTRQQLQDADTDTTADLYEYDFDRSAGERIDQLSAGGIGDPTPGTGAKVQGVVDVSYDGSHVYFVAEGVLTTAPNQYGASAREGADNLYVYERDGGHPAGQTKFIATLGTGSEEASRLWHGERPIREASTNRDGSVLAFVSEADLTGQPLAGTRQLYVYEDGDSTLACASCPGDGAPPAGSVGGMARGRIAEPRYVSSGGAVFFSTPAALLPADVNHVSDVYEYDHGELGLISTGVDASPSRFGDASVDGSSVFFLTKQAMVSEDDEPGVEKVYAARVGGGFAASPPAAPQCSGEGCRVASLAAPVFGVSASMSFTGAGNEMLAPSLTAAPESPRKRTATQIKARKLAKALKACRKTSRKAKNAKGGRAACDRRARERYGAKAKTKKSSKAKSGKGGRRS